MVLIPAVGTVPVGEEAVPSTTTIIFEASGNADTASDLSAPQLITDPLLDGRLPAASALKGNISVVGPISGSAATASGLSGDLLEGTLIDAQAPTAGSARGALSHMVAISGTLPIAASAKGDKFDIDMGMTGSAPMVSDIFGALGIPIPVSGSSGTSSGIRGGITDPLFKQWRFIDPQTSEVYRFETNPSVVPEPTRRKNLVYTGRSQSNQQIAFKQNGETLRVRVTGKLLTQDQLDEITAWARKRYPVKLRDDLDREITVYVESFDARRGHKVNHEYFHDYTLTYALV